MHLFRRRDVILLMIYMVFQILHNPTNGGAVELTKENIGSILENTELVCINFYAHWCHFSRLLAPIFKEAAEKVAAEFPDKGKVLFGQVDCDNQTALASRYNIKKYPTLKIIRNGDVTKQEYRGQRTADALLAFVKKQLENPIKEFQALKDLESIDSSARHIIGYFDHRDQTQYDTFRKVASYLKDDCQYRAGFGQAVEVMHPPGTPIIVFRPDTARSNEKDETFTGDFSNYTHLQEWVHTKCVPLVREITFENAEELTEEGLPFLILFYKPNDTDIIIEFKEVVERELIHQKGHVNFLTANGVRFAHPLEHLDKRKDDLPLIVIDSFRHMYLYSDITNMRKPGHLRQFLDDLHSGKLHREFHYGPDVTNDAVDVEIITDAAIVTAHPESTFKKLAPSKTRYTLLKDEL